MPLFTLKVVDQDLNKAILEKIITDTIDYEKDFENWLENSPNVLIDEDTGGGVFWIGRQVTASVGDSDKHPDLIGIDSSGDLVIVELKKGKTPREVIAQGLEYAAWGANLGYDDLDRMAREYKQGQGCEPNKSLKDFYKEVFFPDSEEDMKVEFNRNQKLYIVAEEVSPVVRQVVQYLRAKYKMDVSCMEYQVLKSKQGDYLISTAKLLGFEETKSDNSATPSLPRWSHPSKVKTVVAEAVKVVTKGNPEKTFTPSEIIQEILKEYPEMNSNTVRCQLIQDCVNHTSRKHYPSGQQDLYFLVEHGKYRLYDPEKDGKWDWKGESTG